MKKKTIKKVKKIEVKIFEKNEKILENWNTEKFEEKNKSLKLKPNGRKTMNVSSPITIHTASIFHFKPRRFSSLCCKTYRDFVNPHIEYIAARHARRVEWKITRVMLQKRRQHRVEECSRCRENFKFSRHKTVEMEKNSHRSQKLKYDFPALWFMITWEKLRRRFFLLFSIVINAYLVDGGNYFTIKVSRVKSVSWNVRNLLLRQLTQYIFLRQKQHFLPLFLQW